MGFISLVRFQLGFWLETVRDFIIQKVYICAMPRQNHITSRTFRSDSKSHLMAWQLRIWVGAVLIYIQWETN